MALPRFTIRYTRQEVVAGTETRTGRLSHHFVTIQAETQKDALLEWADEYLGTDARITSIVAHPVLRVVVDNTITPTQRGRATGAAK